MLQSAKDSKSAKQKFSEDLTDYLAVPGNLNKFQQEMFDEGKIIATACFITY